MKYYQLSATQETQKCVQQQQKLFMRASRVDARVKPSQSIFHIPSRHTGLRQNMFSARCA
jgi:hypothetical protein